MNSNKKERLNNSQEAEDTESNINQENDILETKKDDEVINEVKDDTNSQSNASAKLKGIIDKEQEDKNKKKNKKKYILYSLIVLIITVVVLTYSLLQPISEDDSTKVYEKIPEFIANMDVMRLVIYFVIIFISFLLNAFIMFLYAKMYQKHYRYHQALAIQAIDNFYSSITPGSYGGEIAKVFVFKKQGIEISNAASMMVMNFIVYQSVLIIMGTLSLIIRFDAILNIPAFPLSITINGNTLPAIPFYIFIILGFALNLLTIVLLFAMSSSRRLHNFVINHLINFLGKIKLVKNVEKKKESLRLQVENYRIELQRLRSNLLFTLVLFFFTFLAQVIASSFPFFAGLAINGFVGMEEVNYFQKFWDCVFYMNFHQMVTGLIPIPGTAGIAEYVFDRLFGSAGGFFSPIFYSQGGANLLVVFWRITTFYIPFLFYGIVAATYKSRGVRVGKGYVLPVSTKKATMTLTIETMGERKTNLEEELATKQKKKEDKIKEKKEKDKYKKEEE